MVFKAFSKPKAEISLQAQDTSAPGARLPLEVKLNPKEEIKARGVRVELVGEETYYVKEHYRTAKGQSHTRLAPRDNTFSQITQMLAEQPALVPGVEQKWNVSLQLPAEAPPACRGEIVNIRWTQKAVLDVPNRPDQSQEVPLRVLCLPPRTRISDLPGEKMYDDVVLTLKAPGVAATGETLVGQLTLQVKEKLSPRSIRVELVQDEVAGERESDRVVVKKEISSSVSFNPGESPSFDFFLAVPAEAQPTARSERSSLRWKVRAVIDRKMKGDFNVEQEIFLYNAVEPKGK